ncbi:MAG: spore germination protein, partial [Clostridia bacterium]|nr:spore germination protein [Clostridia bacterium]
PLFLQFLILEFLLDILRFPWINRKDSLSSFFSVAIIIMVFTFTAKTGWFATEAVFLEVLALISGLSYSDFKLFLTAKFERIFLLFAVQAFGWLGMIIATACIVILNIANKFHKKFINLSYARNNNDLK